METLKTSATTGLRPENNQNSSGRFKSFPFYLLPAGGLAILAILQLVRAFTALFSPVVLDYCEIMVGGAAEQFRLSGSLANIYSPPAAPYGMPGVQYPPLFILLVSGLVQLSGLGVVLAERLLAWSLYCVAGGLAGLIAWQETGRKWPALAAATLPFCFWGVIIFVHAARVDPLALCLSLLTAYFYRRFSIKQAISLKTLALVALLAALAFFSKQTYLAVNAAIFFDLLLSRGTKVKRWNYRPALLYAGLFVAWAGLGLALCGWLSGGHFFGIFEPARAGSFIFERVPGFLQIFTLDHLPLLAIAGVMLLAQWRRGTRFWPLYTLFAALACVAIIKEGAVDYYFNELSYVLAVSVALALAEPALLQAKKGRWLVGLGLAAQFIIALVMLVGWSHWRDFDLSRRAYYEGLDLARAAFAAEAQGGKPALVLVDSFLLETGRAEQIGDYFIYSVLLTNGKRDSGPLLADLESQRYGLIMTENFVRWSPAVEAALARRYNLRVIYGEEGRKPYNVYTPRPHA